MKNLIEKKIRVVKKKPKSSTQRLVKPSVTMRCGAVVSKITFVKDATGKLKGEIRHNSDFSVPQLKDTNSIMQEETI